LVRLRPESVLALQAEKHPFSLALGQQAVALPEREASVAASESMSDKAQADPVSA